LENNASKLHFCPQVTSAATDSTLDYPAASPRSNPRFWFVVQRKP